MCRREKERLAERCAEDHVRPADGLAFRGNAKQRLRRGCRELSRRGHRCRGSPRLVACRPVWLRERDGGDDATV